MGTWIDEQERQLRDRIKDLEELIEAIVISSPQHVIYITDMAKALVGEGVLFRQRAGGAMQESMSWVRRER